MRHAVRLTLLVAALALPSPAQTWLETQRIVSPVPAPLTFFGRALDFDGMTLVAGMDRQLAASFLRRGPDGLFVEEQTTSSTAEFFGGAVAIDGSTAVVSARQFPVGNVLRDVECLALDPLSGELRGVERLTGLLLDIDPATGMPTPLGPTGYLLVQGLTFDTSGVLYGVETGTDQLITIDPATGASTAVGNTGVVNLEALAFDPASGFLFAANSITDKVMRVDPATGAATPLPQPIGFDQILGLAVHPTTHVLYGVKPSSLPQGTGELITIDKATGAGALVGFPLGAPQALTFSTDGSTLYASNAFTEGLDALDPLTGWGVPVAPGYKTAGAVFVYERSPAPGAAWVEDARLLAPNPNSSFGWAVALEGDTLAVTHAASAAEVVVFERDAGGPGAWGSVATLGPFSFGQFGHDLALCGDFLFVGAPSKGAFSQGVVHVYERDLGGPDAWGQSTILPGPSSTDDFGFSLACRADTLVVGAPHESHAVGVRAGAAYVYERVAGTWTQTQRLTPSGGGDGHEFGHEVAVDESHLAVGSKNGPSFPPAVYFFERAGSGTPYEEVAQLAPSGPSATFGDELSLHDGMLVAGSPGDDDFGTSSGAVYVFEEQPVVAYCTAGTTSSGCNATMSATGVPSRSSATGFDVTTAGVEGQRQGLLYFGTSGAKATPWGAGSSYRCVAPPVQRTAVQSSGGTPGACDGGFALDFNAWMAAYPAKAPAVGATTWIQSWFRDPPAPQTTSFSDALRFTVTP